MKIFLSLLITGFALSLPFSSVLAQASGACSWHGGVDCSEGPNIFGRAVCNDGTESSVNYGSVLQCTQDPNRLFFCNTREECDVFHKIVDDGIQGLERTYNEIVNRINSQESSQIDAVDRACADSIARAENAMAGARLTGTDQGSNYIQGVRDQCERERNRIRQSTRLDRQDAETRKGVSMSRWTLFRARIIERIYSCPANSSKMGNTGFCVCNLEFQPVGGVCMINPSLLNSLIELEQRLSSQSTTTAVAQPTTMVQVVPIVATSSTVVVESSQPVASTSTPVVASSSAIVPPMLIISRPRYFVGTPKTRTDLLNCLVVANLKAKTYYLRGSKTIKSLAPSGKECLQSELEAKAKKYKKLK
jgi:hypothetical protein